MSDAARMRYIVGILPDEPGRTALAQHAVERSGDSSIGLREDAKAWVANGAEIFKATVGSAVDDGEDFKERALLC